jgi:2-polyprenyl-6-hydroxyphenyl methylase/3-demethylubiquinone-9 3-methyltransferase
MPVANLVFDHGAWWDSESFLHGLHTLLGPVRDPYLIDALEYAGFGPRSSVLDVGSGGGFIAASLAEAGYDVIGVDPSQSATMEARKHVEANFAVAVGRSLPLPDASMDAVVCSEVLEHVESAEDVIAEISRVLQADGVLVFSMPNRTFLSRLVLIDLAQKFSPTKVLPDDLHEWDRFITPTEFHELATRNGLVVTDLQGVSLPLRHIPSAIAALIALKRGRISYATAGARVHLGLSRSRSVAYIGTATKTQHTSDRAGLTT